MKKYLIAFLAVLLAVTVAWAADPTYGPKIYHKQGGDELVTASGGTITVESGGAVTIDSGGTITINGTLAAARERSFTLPLTSFVTADPTPVSITTAPGLEIDDLMPAIVWADGEVTPVLTTFRIPSDYASGGAFRVLATESDSTTPNQVDFDVYINKDGVASDSSATGQTPVALAGTTSTPDVVTLTPATDQASFAAGAWVTIRIWRDNVAAGTGDLEVKGVEFFYTASN
ncbi:MAG: hypothetical protein ACYDHW_10815 [Syntrophorhabdaceae bacterium]